MNNGLLIKLIKLANNNPNENEANAAARKVCRMIADADFEVMGDKSKIAWGPIHPANKDIQYTAAPDLQDFINSIIQSRKK